MLDVKNTGPFSHKMIEFILLWPRLRCCPYFQECSNIKKFKARTVLAPFSKWENIRAFRERMWTWMFSMKFSPLKAALQILFQSVWASCQRSAAAAWATRAPTPTRSSSAMAVESPSMKAATGSGLGRPWSKRAAWPAPCLQRAPSLGSANPAGPASRVRQSKRLLKIRLCPKVKKLLKVFDLEVADQS